MRFPLPWIGEYTQLPQDEAAVSKAYTLSGSEVEGRETVEGETVLDFGITVNRPDCMNVYGLAREASVLLGQRLKPVETACAETGPPASDLTSVRVEAPDLCPRYSARVITGVRVGESPAWMQRRLLQCGLRPINAVVDTTNYVLVELGHPLHAFDMDTLQEHRIVVRRAGEGEKIVTLDEVERTLDPSRLVIADAARPVALAGVMGGTETGVTAATRNVLLEGAVFDPVNIRKTSKALSLRTDASHRFERGVDFEGPAYALDRCARLILEICGGTLAKGRIDVMKRPPRRKAIRLRHERLVGLIGLDIPRDRCAYILADLGFEVQEQADGVWRVTAPSHRVDVTREADLIEEVVRVHGLEDLVPQLPALVDPVGGAPAEQELEERLRDALSAAGCTEVIHMSMTSPELESAFGVVAEPMALRNPLSPQASILRTSLLGPMAACAARNRARGVRQLALFELGRVYLPQDGALPREERRAALLLYSDDPPGRWGDPPAFGLIHLKGKVEAALRRLGLQAGFAPADRPRFQPGLCLTVEAAGAELGVLGSLKPGLLEAAGLKSGAAHAAELSLEGVLALLREPSFKPFSRFPSVTRDFSFHMEKDVRWGDIEERLRGLALPDLVSVRLADCYEGKGVPEGRQSWTFSLVFQSNDRTLTEEDIAPVTPLVTGALRDAFGAVPR